jgi:hypothetical protein
VNVRSGPNWASIGFAQAASRDVVYDVVVVGDGVVSRMGTATA